MTACLASSGRREGLPMMEVVVLSCLRVPRTTADDREKEKGRERERKRVLVRN